jgi:CHAD domain-containing protein
MTTSPAARANRTAHVIGDYVVAQCLAVREGDRTLDSSHATAIHETRVAIRRLRSALRVFGQVLEPLPTTAFDVELQWFAAVLGEVRDCQVLRTRLDSLVTRYADELPCRSVPDLRERIEAELRREYAERWLRLELERRGPRYHQLMAELDDWIEEVPSLADLERELPSVKKLVRDARGVVPRKLGKAIKSGDAELLHSARKASKRARYAAEAAAPILGARTSARIAKRYRTLQELLGEHQDAVLSAEFLRRLASRPDVELGDGAPALFFLLRREVRTGHRAERKAAKVARRSLGR